MRGPPESDSIMTPEMLIDEGRRLAKPCVFLRPRGNGPAAALWHRRDQNEVERTGYRCWITVNTISVPGLFSELGYLRVFSDAVDFKSGRVELSSTLPTRAGIDLFASAESVLPPIEAVFADGSDAVGEWLAFNGWPREERYNDNFPDSDVVSEYEREWLKEYPITREDPPYAVLGGWHFPCADHDWFQLKNEQLVVLTVQDSEPLVETWRLRSGEFKVIQRIT